jgi:hypothetical protein
LKAVEIRCFEVIDIESVVGPSWKAVALDLKFEAFAATFLPTLDEKSPSF